MKRALLITATLLTLVAASCTPAERAAWDRLSPAGQDAVRAHYRSEAERHRSSRDCYEAIDRHWPGDKGRAKRIMMRESGNNPGAQNRRSSAAGCMQLLSMHSHRFSAVGCSWGRRYEADCNVKAAAHLYRQAGWSPWNV